MSDSDLKNEKFIPDFPRRFNGSSTAYEVLDGTDLSGKCALITGCNAGIGYETAKSLAKYGCKLFLANRNMEATQKAIDEIIHETNASRDNVIFIHLDLASLNSVKKAVAIIKSLLSEAETLNMVILNAGVYGLPYTETEDKMESLVQVNHISHTYLAILLEPLLKKGARVIFVSSESHRFANVKHLLANQSISMTKESYFSMRAYDNSKLYNVLTAKILSEEWKNKGIYVNSLHPGNMVYSNLSKNWWLIRLAFLLVRPFTKSLQQAAATTIYVATAPELEGVTGLYFNNGYYCEESNQAKDKEIAKQVFAITLKMIVDRMGTNSVQEYIDKYPMTIEALT